MVLSVLDTNIMITNNGLSLYCYCLFCQFVTFKFEHMTEPDQSVYSSIFVKQLLYNLGFFNTKLVYLEYQ